MIDITAQVQWFIEERARWSPAQGRKLAETMTRQSGGTMDWDEDAGEGWSRVLVERRVVALICMLGPLVILVGDDTSEMATLTKDLPVIAVPSMDAPILTCDPLTLRAAFGDRTWNNPALNVEQFSAGEFWFCTV